MAKINSGFNALSSVTKLAKYIPKVGTAVNVLNNALRSARPPFNRAYSRVKAIDAKVYPFKRRADQGVGATDRGKIGFHDDIEPNLIL